MESSRHLKGILYMVGTALVFGLGAVLAKIITVALNPFFVSFLSLLLGGLFVAGYLLLRGKLRLPALSRASWVEVILLATIGTALPVILTVAGLAQTSAIKGGFIIQLQGLVTIILAVLFLRERMSRWQVMGAILMLAGSLLVVLRGFDVTNLAGGNWGDVLILCGTLGFGYSFIPAKRLAVLVDSLQLSALRQLLGALVLVPTLFFQRSEIIAPLSWPIVLAFAVYIVTNFCLAYIFQIEGLRLLAAWEAAAIMQSVPLFSIVFALLLLHDSLTPIQLIGGTIAIVGGFIVTRGTASTKAESTPASLASNKTR